jgi:hypothetical protein
MSTPKVTEITRRSDAVAHDTFIDDIATVKPRPSDFSDIAVHMTVESDKPAT